MENSGHLFSFVLFLPFSDLVFARGGEDGEDGGAGGAQRTIGARVTCC